MCFRVNRRCAVSMVQYRPKRARPRIEVFPKESRRTGCAVAAPHRSYSSGLTHTALHGSSDLRPSVTPVTCRPALCALKFHCVMPPKSAAKEIGWGKRRSFWLVPYPSLRLPLVAVARFVTPRSSLIYEELHQPSHPRFMDQHYLACRFLALWRCASRHGPEQHRTSRSRLEIFHAMHRFHRLARPRPLLADNGRDRFLPSHLGHDKVPAVWKYLIRAQLTGLRSPCQERSATTLLPQSGTSRRAEVVG